MASCLDARAHRGAWLLRIEDVDQTRTVDGAADQIRRDLERLGLYWDEELPTQSARTERYRQIIADLLESGQAFACECSRADIRQAGRTGPSGPIYPGTCRHRSLRNRPSRSIRAKVSDRPLSFVDRLAGPFGQRLDRDLGDFVIRRADGFTAYQLAVVVDDQDQSITDVVRGQDLLDSTPRQIWLQQQLRFTTPSYAHVPLVLDETGRKLSKRDQADPIRDKHPIKTLLAAHEFLTGNAAEHRPDTVADFWPWAIQQWAAEHVETHQDSITGSEHA
jgi:glutamyl-Q tRNA(Asp) synthetase